jgi:hypothetical protein
VVWGINSLRRDAMGQHLRPTRREFLQMAALAGATFTTAKALTRGAEKPESRKFEYRTLGRTGLKLPVVSMGSCYAVNLVQAARNEGFVYFHSSGGYAEGEHERLLGKALSSFARCRNGRRPETNRTVARRQPETAGARLHRHLLFWLSGYAGSCVSRALP